MEPINPPRQLAHRRWHAARGTPAPSRHGRVARRSTLAIPRPPPADDHLDLHRGLEAVEVGAVEQADFDAAHGRRSIWLGWPNLLPRLSLSMYGNVTEPSWGLRKSVERMLADYLADLERLVNIDCGTYTKAGVDEVGRWFADTLARAGRQHRGRGQRRPG